MAEAFIVEAVRTPVGKRNGGLSGVHPADLAAHTLRQVVERSGVDPAAVDDVVMGCVMQVGPQTMDIARTAWLSAGLPESVPGVTIDRQCGSSQQAVHFAAQGVLSGTQDLVIAAGVESMSVVPMGTSVRAAAGEGPARAVRPGLEGTLRRHRDLPVPRRPADVREVGHQAGGAGGVLAGEPPAGDHGHRRGPVRRADRPDRGRGERRGTAPGHDDGEDGRAGPAARGLGDHRRGRLADLRRGRRRC